MTDQIYYKIQYPVKQAISTIKKVDLENVGKETYSRDDLEEIKKFLELWENEGKQELLRFVDKLKKV